MKCPNCGAELSPTAGFCGYCGCNIAALRQSAPVQTPPAQNYPPVQEYPAQNYNPVQTAPVQTPPVQNYNPNPVQTPPAQPYAPVQTAPVQTAPYQAPAAAKADKPQNVVLGTVGALVGSLIGAALIVALGQINMVAGIAGLVLAICTIKGYELLGGKLTVPGLVVCVAIMLIVPYFAYQVDWALFISREKDIPFAEAFENISKYNDLGLLENYGTNLGMLYAFTILGGFAQVWNTFKELKKK